MSHVPHDLSDEFPAQATLLRSLKQTDAHVQNLAERHHVLNRDIHRIETEITPASDAHLETLKKERLALLDELAAILAKASANV